MKLKSMIQLGLMVLTLGTGLGASLPASALMGQLRSKDPQARINVRTQPTTRSSAPRFGLPGDVVQVFSRKYQGGYYWYYVKFPISKHIGWIRGDLIRVFETQPRQPVRRSRPVRVSSPRPSGNQGLVRYSSGSVGGGCVYFNETGDSVC